MSTPILATRLYVPPLRPEVVLRPRLIELLDEGLHRKVTLISAPAGFGKSTLASEWVDGCGRPAAWLSLEEGDQDPSRFLTYLVAALQTIDADIGGKVLGAASAPQPPLNESLLTILLNDIAGTPEPFLIVLDDYHLVDCRAVDEAVGFLIGHQPPQMHLVIATREDPNLPLARLRAHSQLTELRAADLRFTAEEAATFLGPMTGLDLAADQVRALETRTEGWIAGLQLAALSMRGREDVQGFIQAFAGDNRYIVDYLLEEVLHTQPAPLRTFLLETSILTRLSGPLCDAVTGRPGGKQLLETLDRGNLFVVPLDERRHWFRYHHLFADVLQAHASQEQPELVPDLHSRASQWYEQNDLPADAIHHALAAADYERAATLMELQFPIMDATFQNATWLAWAKQLPETVVQVRPALCVGYAWAFLDGGHMDEGEARLAVADRWLGADADADADAMIVVDPEQFQNLAASIATARSYIAQARGDVSGAAGHAQRALDLTPADDPIRRGVGAALLGLAHWAGGELDLAHQSIADGMEGFCSAGQVSFAISGTYGLAEIRMIQGRLQDAVETYEQALRLAKSQGEPPLLGTAELYLGLGELSLQQGDSDLASGHLLRSEELGEAVALPDFPYRKRITGARFKIAQGDLDGALELYGEAARIYYPNPMPNVCPVAALIARVWIAQGRLTEARGWARDQRLAVDDELSFLREFEHLTLARLLVAEGRSGAAQERLEDALGLVDRLRLAAEEGGRTSRVIEALILQALVYEARDDLPGALGPLQRAMVLAERSGYVRIFADEGAPMARLLSEAANEKLMPQYTTRLRQALQPDRQPREVDSPPAPGPAASATQPLVEPLSTRELQVLGLIAEGLSNQQISDRLFLALSTVKGHNLKIFGKLQVKRRTEAVARARELGLM